ncbi:MAG: protein phosphatase 2C domain-containing protein [Micrococcales bacterium]|nr:protein phosphatase 2C domain-containing protein [Micrococcales bacterium]
MPITLRYAARSDLGLGPKPRNEDSGYAGPHLLVLADGMGGHAGGDVASSMIVGMLAPLDDDVLSAEQAIASLEGALHRANARLATAMEDNARLLGMGSTTIAMLRTGNKLAMAHIGDSRAFLLRGAAFTQITKDHSFVQQLVDEGRISKEAASHHPQRSVVTRVMTGAPGDEPDTSLREAKLGDRYLLCSDGLSDFVGAEVIEEILRGAATPEEAADRCIEVALKASTRDNVTVIVADVVDAEGDELPATVPQIVGAAARRLPNKTRPIPTSPAAKAAALTRDAARDANRDGGGDGGRGGASDSDDSDDSLELAEDGPRSARKRRTRGIIGAVLVIAVLAAGIYAAYDWSQRQLYIAADGGTVAIYRGVSANLGPIHLSHVEVGSDVKVSDLPADLQGAVNATIPVTDLTEGQVRLETLRLHAILCQAMVATGASCGTRAPVLGPTTMIPSSLSTGAGPSSSVTRKAPLPPVTVTVTVTVTAQPAAVTVRAISPSLPWPPASQRPLPAWTSVGS